jgi:hypothetical protein
MKTLPGLLILTMVLMSPASTAETGGTRGDRASVPRSVPLDADAQQIAVATLSASLDVEREILRRHQDLYRAAAEERDGASRRLQQLLGELDAFVTGSSDPAPEAVAAKEREIAEAETRRQGAAQKCRELLGRIQEMQERVAGLDRKIASMRENLPRPTETLSGSWRVTLLPSANHGTFVLRQIGTIVQGQYQLDGGWKGSLQGTYIDGKLYLQRIDSKLGRSSELDGYLSSDGTSIRGTWRNYGLADGGVASGSWTATRLQEE